MENKLEKFKDDFENYLKNSNANGFKLEYHRPQEPSLFMLWVQKHFDEVGVIDANIEFNDGTIEIKNIKYNPLGLPIFPYIINMKSGANSPNNIINAKVKYLLDKP